MNSITINTDMQLAPLFSAFDAIGIIPRSGMAGTLVILLVMLCETSILFSIMTELIRVPLTPSMTFVDFYFVHGRCSEWGETNFSGGLNWISLMVRSWVCFICQMFLLPMFMTSS